jgi:cell division protein FtsW
MNKQEQEADSKTKIYEGRYDLTILFPVLFLVGIGIVMVYSASSALALKKYGTDYYFLKKQVMFAVTGIAVLIFCRHFSFRYYRCLAYPLLCTSFIFLGLIHISDFGYSAGGSTRWVHIYGFTFQPSELARFAMIVYLAYSLSKKHERVKEFSVGFIPHILMLSVFVGLIILQPDFGFAVILTIITWVMLFVGGVPVLHLSTALIPLLPLAYFFMINAEYRIARLISFLDPWQYPTDEGYQAIHSLMAFGTGGLSGAGIGKGYQKLFYLPEPHTDFIFSVVGEELGFMGCLFIICLYGIIIVRGIIIAGKAENYFGALLAAGITTTLGLQVCVNMGVTLGMLPTKGLTLPFLSYGGTSLLISMACAGILMNIKATAHKTD